ncbi:PAS domain-containing hybrid sensor histidine kinase/response regulator [Rheinheimera tangshanensis]|uniref:histidine kinase n=2 Tax=Rheinheimera TaxID=67575 RepID=A0A5C8LW59_9GAMM|nr:PAS-domain containing protein [Rheinheimera tangshanensis]TXK81496.1 response regulator [Rheinheimera tangshanensis]GGM57552.1 two-component sensor [Rheinheimera tangshanensis]
MSAWIVALLALLYVGLLFFIANWGERHAGDQLLRKYGGLLYSLALAVYCTSWTYYGAVGTAVTQGWDYIPIYLGPILVFLFAQSFLFKLLYVAKKQNVASITDFISARYGKRKNIALVTALLCLVVVIPYIALQLKAVASSYQVLLGHDLSDQSLPWWQDTAWFSAMAMTVFAILFGTRKVQLTEQNRGVMVAIAFESVVKLFALLCLALMAYWLLLPEKIGVSQFVEHASHLQYNTEHTSWLSFAVKTLLAMTAIFLLPRQFHVAFVENVDHRHLRHAKRWYSSYLFLVTLVVIPIALAGMHLFPGQEHLADSFVLLIPEKSGWHTLSVLVFIGGFSAATSMIIISTLALSTMISNDVVMPTILRRPGHGQRIKDYSGLILLVRRTMIITVMLLSYGYYALFARNYELAETGLLAFALAIQLAPAVVGGLYWRHGNAFGVYAGLAVGFTLWFFCLMVPQLSAVGVLEQTLLQQGLFGIEALKPTALFGVQLDTLSHGVIWSLGLNLCCYLLFSLLVKVNLKDRLQAAAFVKPTLPLEHKEAPVRRVRVRRTDITMLLERFIGAQRCNEAMAEFQRRFPDLDLQDSIAGPELVAFVERELAGVIGAASALAVVSAATEGRQLELEDVVTLFDDTTQAIQFSRKILFSTLEHLSQGVSVVDRDLKLVAWNKAYLKMFDYPDGMIRIGRPVADIVRFNAERGLFGEGSPEEHVSKRIAHMQNGTSHVFQRVRPDGKVIEMRGNPIPGGGFVTSFTDITEHVRAVQQLAEAKQHLEQRVQERTHRISEINQELMEEVARRSATELQLLQAKAEAEAANVSKTRFLALASHDILQPLNAARLFTAALQDQSIEGHPQKIIHQLDNSLKATEELIATLLDIARLDDGRLQPKTQVVSLQSILKPLTDEFSWLAEQKQLRFRTHFSEWQVQTDGTYLRRILQNILSNAIKYTPSGQVLLSCRKRGQQVLLQIWDSGPGVAEHELKRIFDDFYRVDSTARGQQGVGLGLAVVQRMTRLLGHQLDVRSVVGKGTVFNLYLPLVSEQDLIEENTLKEIQSTSLPQWRVLCVDDDSSNLAALSLLLQQWQLGEVKSYVYAEQLLQEAPSLDKPDLLIMDYQLGQGINGLELYQQLQPYWGKVPGILVSAAPEPDLAQRAKAEGLLFLAKPIKPAALRAGINHLKNQRP